MRKIKTLFMETTRIEPQQTAAEIQRVLGEYGVGAVMTEYDQGEVVALTFKMKLKDKDVPYRMPCRWEAINKILLSRRKRLRKTEEIAKQAKRIAWRTLLRWIEAQLAFTATDMAKVQEVFMPYMQVNLTQTLYEKLEQKGSIGLLLEDKR